MVPLSLLQYQLTISTPCYATTSLMAACQIFQSDSFMLLMALPRELLYGEMESSL